MRKTINKIVDLTLTSFMLLVGMNKPRANLDPKIKASMYFCSLMIVLVLAIPAVCLAPIYLEEIECNSN